MNYNRGSQWRKWDLHIHTPETAKNNNFGNDSDAWGKYLVALENNEDIAVLGITDYFSIENYKKTKVFQTQGRLAGKTILPNVELRITPVTKTDTPINIHVIFNPKLEDSFIEREFFRALSYRYKDQNYQCIKQDLIALGRAYKNNNSLDETNAYYEGVGQYIISYDELKNLVEKDCLKDNVIIAVSNSNKDGNSGIQHSSLAATREEIYRMSHIIFSGNPRDISYFLGKSADNEETIKNKFKSLMPCITGSDAHSFDKINVFTDNRTTWIKADPTFEGLKQILCEPEGRIVIQDSHPEEKKSYNVIDSIQFVDPSGSIFQPERIYFNSGLNAIIGGKSSGKSLLLNMMAEEMGAKNSKIGGYKHLITGTEIEVYYKDAPTQKRNSTDGRKIEFLPQLYINDLITNKEHRDTTDRSFNTFIEELIRQDDGIKENMDETKAKISSSLAAIDIEITKWEQLDNQLKLKKEERGKLGDKKSIENEILRINSEIDKLKENAGWSEDDKNKYTKLVQENKDYTINLNSLEQKIRETKRLENYLNLQIKSEILDSTSFSCDIPDVNNLMERVMTSLSSELDKIVALFIAEIASKIDANTKHIESTSEQIQKNNKSLEPYVSKNTSQKEIEKQERIKAEEENKIAQIDEKDKEITDIRTEISNLKFIHHYQVICDAYYDLASSLNTAISAKWEEDETRLQIKASTEFKSAVFIDSIIGVVNNRSYLKSQFNRDGNIIFEINDYIYDKDNHIHNITNLLDFAIRETDRYTNFKSGKSNKEFLASLLKDCFTIEYDVIKNGDSLHKMSEGKKGIVVLQLYLSLSGSDCPILIDQPEDNLDNRTVYQELNDYIKQCKKRRQIIMVSHNANLVVNTDAENVIVANQSGEDNKDNRKYKFEYVNGALEDSFINESKKGVLYKQGIREHVCEILEGGVDAFKKREEKYHIKN